jgi:hypothetical protein
MTPTDKQQPKVAEPSQGTPALDYIRNMVDHDHKLYCRKDGSACVATCVNGRAILAEAAQQPTASEQEFCRHCGAGMGKHRRAGEGTCPECEDK